MICYDFPSHVHCIQQHIAYINSCTHTHAASSDFVNHFYRIATSILAFFFSFCVMFYRCSFCCRQSMFALTHRVLYGVYSNGMRVAIAKRKNIFFSCTTGQFLCGFLRRLFFGTWTTKWWLTSNADSIRLRQSSAELDFMTKIWMQKRNNTWRPIRTFCNQIKWKLCQRKPFRVIDPLVRFISCRL